jgi:hypothetical protein
MEKMTMEICHPNELLLAKLASPTNGRFRMTKRYVTYPVQKRDRSGNIVRGFVVGLAEFGCLGTRLYDLSGYPHESEAHAIFSDWQAVGNDMWKSLKDSEQEQQTDDREGRERESSKEFETGS